jgi:hypothetical protein
MSDQTIHTDNLIIWLEVHSPTGCSVRSPFALKDPFAAKDKKHLLQGIFDESNIPDIEVSDMERQCHAMGSPEYVSNDGNHRIKVKPEYNPLVAQAFSQNISKSFVLYTIRHPTVDNLPKLKLNRQADGPVLQPYVMSGHQHFSLGESVQTFVAEQDALLRAKDLQNSSPRNKGDWQFRYDISNFAIDVSDGNYGAQRCERYAYTGVATKGHQLEDIVTVTEVFVHNYSKAGYAELRKSKEPFQFTALDQ